MGRRDAGDFQLFDDFGRKDAGVVLAQLLAERLLVLVQADLHRALLGRASVGGAASAKV
jgi:hypothetical protein